MNINQYAMIGKELPKPSAHFRIKNLGTNVVAPAYVIVVGGNSSFYNESSENRLLYKKRDMEDWKTVPSGMRLSIEGMNNYIDFKVTGGSPNSGLTSDFLHFYIGKPVGESILYTPSFDSQVQGNIQHIGSDPTIANAYNSLLSGNTKLIHASGLTIPSGITGTSGFYGGFNDCRNLVTPPSFVPTPEYQTGVGTLYLGQYAFAFLFNNCTSLTSSPDLGYIRFSDYSCTFAFNGCSSLSALATLSGVSVGRYAFRCMYGSCISIPNLSSIYLKSGIGGNPMYEGCYKEMFAGCTSLTDITANDPEYGGVGHVLLPASGTASYCYQFMFQGCTHIHNQSPYNFQLPASTVQSYAYYGMFSGCTALKYTPVLGNFTKMYTASLKEMFADCTSLHQIFGELSGASIEGANCCEGMFSGCTALSTVHPKFLPINATSSIPAGGGACFAKMFAGCTALSSAPNLPYINSQVESFRAMFSGCTSLTTAPQLHMVDVHNMGEECCKEMFAGCQNLNKVYTEQEAWYVGEDENNRSYFNTNWLYGVSQTGTFTCKDSLERIYDFSHIPYDSTHKWSITPLVDTPYVRYQNFTTDFQNLWSNTSAWNTRNEMLAFGAYEGTNMGSTAIVYNVTMDPSESVKSVPYPWAPADKYKIWFSWYDGNMSSNCVSDLDPTDPQGLRRLPAISANNNTHTWDIPSGILGIHPSNVWEGFTNPYMLPVDYTGTPASTVPCGFIFVVQEDSATWADNNLLLIGASGQNCAVTISGIPQDIESYVMIKKINKVTGKSNTDWCDVTGWWKLSIPISSTEWLAIKNGCSYFQQKRNGNYIYPVDPQIDHPYRISISGTTSGIVSGNIRSLGSLFFEKSNGESSTGYPISFWGQNCLKQLFKGCTNLMYISPNLFKDVNFWCCPSGCYEMFAGCTRLINSPDITSYYGGYDPYIFAYMFSGCTALSTMGSIDLVGEYPNDAPMYFKQYACKGMFKGCTRLENINFLTSKTIDGTTYNGKISAGLGVEDSYSYYTTGDNVVTVNCTGEHAFDEMFAGCNSLRAEYMTNITIGRLDKYSCQNMFANSNIMSFSGNCAEYFKNQQVPGYAFYGMFSGCSQIKDVDFGMPSNNSGIVCLNTDESQFANMFQYCSSLTGVPNFKIVSAAPYCCANMFANCTSLKTGISVASRPYTGSYYGMYADCTALTGVEKVLLSTTATSACYAMFSGCISLTNANNAITISNNTYPYCYNYMFENCSSLMLAPSIYEPGPPATVEERACWRMFLNCNQLQDFPLERFAARFTMSGGAYADMFKDCTSLTLGLNIPYGSNLLYDVTAYEFVSQIPTLNTIGFKHCQSGMFEGCTSLQVTPVLENLSNRKVLTSRMEEWPYGAESESIHQKMFYNCPNLSAIIVKQDYTDDGSIRQLGNNSEKLMFVDDYMQNNYEITSTSKLLKVLIYDNMPDSMIFANKSVAEPFSTFWGTARGASQNVYTVLPSLVSGSPAGYQHLRSTYIGSDMVSTPLTFTSLDSSNATITMNGGGYYSLNHGQSWNSYTANSQITLAPGKSVSFSGNLGTAASFSYSGIRMRIYGNVNSVHNWSSSPCNHNSQFAGRSWVYDAGGLYLPFSDGSDGGSWRNMFGGCANMIKTPRMLGNGDLETVKPEFLVGMFSGCTSITEAPAFTIHSFENTATPSAASWMFAGCTHLKDARNIYTCAINGGCFSHMFDGCTNLKFGISIGSINVTNNSVACCEYMYNNCSGLISANIPLIQPSTDCFQSMFKNCVSLEEAMIGFDGSNSAPVLGCYENMFAGCTALRYVRVNFTTWNNNAGTTNWMSGVPDTGGTFVKPAALPATRGVNNIPTNWITTT